MLILLPSDSNKLLVAWKGPYKVLERRGKVDYLIETPKGPRLYHVNLLKHYFRRSQVNFAEVLDETSFPTECLPSPVELFCCDGPEEYSSRLPVTPDG